MIPIGTTFRAGFVLQALGLLLMLVSQGPLWCASGYTLINTGVFLNGWFLPPHLKGLRIPILALTITGSALQLAAVTWILLTGEITNIKYLIPTGLTLVFTGACLTAAGLARGHRLPEARWLPPVLALLIVSILVLYATGNGTPARVLLAATLAVQLSLTRRINRIRYPAEDLS